MSFDNPLERRVHELQHRCAQLEAQLDKAKTEQINYLQNVSHQLVRH